MTVKWQTFKEVHVLSMSVSNSLFAYCVETSGQLLNPKNAGQYVLMYYMGLCDNVATKFCLLFSFFYIALTYHFS